MDVVILVLYLEYLVEKQPQVWYLGEGGKLIFFGIILLKNTAEGFNPVWYLPEVS